MPHTNPNTPKDDAVLASVPKLVSVNFNGLQELDPAAQLHNLSQAPLDDAQTFVAFLNAFGREERKWWQSIGWVEGHRYFQNAGERGREFYRVNVLIRDRDERLPARTLPNYHHHEKSKI